MALKGDIEHVLVVWLRYTRHLVVAHLIDARLCRLDSRFRQYLSHRQVLFIVIERVGLIIGPLVAGPGQDRL